ncbi:MAG TPA: OsmC family protein [Gaiellaceae bacterium]|nr:OsmC family protein [Gaiellaceae bacterium]
MSTMKDFRFPVEVERGPNRTMTLTARGKPQLSVATPPEFRNGVAGFWSPEDLLVAAASTCYALTLRSIAERRSLPLLALEIDAAGHVTKRADRRLGFVVIELAVTVTTEAAFEEEAERAARDAENACLVANALAIPVEVELTVKSVAAEIPVLAG